MRSQHKYRIALAISIILIATNSLLAQGKNNRCAMNWSSGTGSTLPAGRWEIGLFQPLRYGFSESLEFSTHPVIFFIMPNFNLKWSHHSIARFTIASRHGFIYPTLLLRTISREGIGGIISPEFHIPHLFSFSNELLFSKQLLPNHLFTGKIGFNFAVKSGKLDKRTTMDLPLVFPRLNVFYQGYGFRLGGDLIGRLSPRWNYLIDTDFFLYPGADKDFAFEHKGMILWNKSSRFRLCFGYKLAYGEYPFGTQWHLLVPIFDLQWAWE